MKRLAALLLTAAVLCGVAACDNPQKAVDQLRQEIAAYKANPTDDAQAKIEADLAALDTQRRGRPRKRPATAPPPKTFAPITAPPGWFAP
jgi:hypothetical protein